MGQDVIGCDLLARRGIAYLYTHKLCLAQLCLLLMFATWL